MFTNGYSGRRYSSHQSRQGRNSTQAGFSSLLPSSRQANSSHQPTPQATSGHASRNTYTSEYEGELTHLISPPTPPPSLDQILSTQPSSNRPWQPETMPTPSHRNIYEEFAEEFCVEPDSSSSAQPETDDYRRIYSEYAQIIVPTPHSNSGQQSTTSRSTPTVPSQASASRFPGVRYKEGKWVADISHHGKRHWVGSFRTPEEARQRLAECRTSLGLSPAPRKYSRRK